MSTIIRGEVTLEALEPNTPALVPLETGKDWHSLAENEPYVEEGIQCRLMSTQLWLPLVFERLVPDEAPEGDGSVEECSES